MRKKLPKAIVAASLSAVLLGSSFSINAAIPGSGLKVGAWLGVQPNAGEINQWQSLANYKLDTVMTYMDWGTNFNSVKSTVMDSIYNNGSKVTITWEPWGLNNNDIIRGAKDDYIRNMANDMKSYNKEIYISLMHEANGNWYPWAIGDSKVNTNDTYKKAYQHVVDIFRKQGARNVKFIWNINAGSSGTGATFTGHYPGDAYVDYVAIDGYNWGPTQSWGSSWQSFDSIFASAYQALSSINKPVFITEFSSTETGGDKAAWITDAFNTIQTKYPKIELVSWFGENKEQDWRINSSPATLQAFKTALKGTGVAASPSQYVPSPSQYVPVPSQSTGTSVADVKINATTGQSIGLDYTITAKGNSQIDLSKLKIRYTFSKADSKNMNVFIDNAAAQLNVAPYYQPLNSDVKTSITRDGGNYVLEVSFKNAFFLKPNAGSVQIKIRLANDDWSSIGTGFTEKNIAVLY